MFESVKAFLCSVLRIPPEPDDPMGDVAALKVFRASYRYYLYRLLVWGLKCLLEVGVALFAVIFIALQMAAQINSGRASAMLIVELAAVSVMIVGGAAFKTAASFFLVRLDYEMRWYKVSDRSLRIREGVFTVREITMTFANIQNISVSQGPIQRLFGIADLKVDSAGGGMGLPAAAKGQGEAGSCSVPHTAYFKGIDNADEIRRLMASRMKRMLDSGLGHSDEEAAATATAPHHEFEAAALQGRLEMYRRILEEARGLRSTLEGAPSAT